MWVIQNKEDDKFWGPFWNLLELKEFIVHTWPEANPFLMDEDVRLKIIVLNSPNWEFRDA